MPVRASGGPFTPLDAIFTLVANEGGWSEPQYPKIIGNGRYSYMGTVSGSDGDALVIVFDGDTGTSYTRLVHAALGGIDGNPDMHDNPALTIRSDGKLLVAVTAHADSVIRLRVSTNTLASDPTLSGGFATEFTIDPAVGLHDYPILLYLGSLLYLFWRNIPSGSDDAHLKYVTSASDGDSGSWGSATDIYNNPTKTAYWQVNGNGERIDVLTFDDNEGAVTNNLLKHFWFNADGDFFQSDGDPIVAGLPLAPTDIDTITSTGGHHLFCLEYDPDGRIGFTCSRRVSGSHFVIRGILTAGTWAIDQITTSSVTYSYGNALDPTNFDRALVTRWSGGRADVWSFTKASGSWVGTNRTSGLTGNSMWPQFSRNRGTGLAACLLGSGHYTTYNDYLFDIVGVRGLTD